MRGKHPQTILTDIDSGLRDAVSRELPNTKHVICVWHILSKLSSWFSLPLGLQYANFKVQFDMLWHLESIADFEHQWDLLIAQFDLASDKHMALLYLYRASWPFAFIRTSFLARTPTLDFFQSLETFLKRILSAQTCLQVFFEQVKLTVFSLVLCWWSKRFVLVSILSTKSFLFFAFVSCRLVMLQTREAE